MQRRRARVCAAVAFVLASATARGETIELAPGPAEVGFRAYGLGLLPIDGRFTRFHGALAFHRPDHADCTVTLTVDLQSLVMDQASVRDDVLGPDEMDAAQFPRLTYAGRCQAEKIAGELTLRGVTHPFALSIAWTPDQAKASGHLRRAEWGMTGKPLLAGSTVRIDVAVSLAPPGRQAAR